MLVSACLYQSLLLFLQALNSAMSQSTLEIRTGIPILGFVMDNIPLHQKDISELYIFVNTLVLAHETLKYVNIPRYYWLINCSKPRYKWYSLVLLSHSSTDQCFCQCNIVYRAILCFCLMCISLDQYQEIETQNPIAQS